MTDSLLATSSPVFEVAGQVRGELARDLVRLEVEEDTEGLKTFSGRFLAIGPKGGGEEESLLYLDGSILDFGKALKVSIGPPQGAREIFKGVVSAIEVEFREGEEPEVIVDAEDALMKLRLTRRSKMYEKMSDAEIAEEIASAHSLTPATDAEGPTYDVVQQWNMSDLAFLRERARLVRAEVWVDKGTLYFQGRPKRKGTDVTLVRGNHLIELTARADLAHQRSSVRVHGFDAQGVEAIDEGAGDDAIRAETSGGKTGPSVVQSVYGERISHRTREVPLTSGEARDWARAEMLRRARGFVRVRGVTRGTPDLIVGSHVTLERVGAPFEGGGYHVCRVRHTYDLAQGHRTDFDAERGTLGAGL